MIELQDRRYIMGVRIFDRIPVLIKVTLNSKTTTCPGTIVNLSETGMFIRTDKMPLLADPEVEITIPLENENIRVLGRLIRRENILDYYQGIGVEVVNPPTKYLNFLDGLLSVL